MLVIALAMAAALVGISPTAAQASEPAQKWPATALPNEYAANNLITDRNGGVRIGCGNVPLSGVDASGKLAVMARIVALPSVNACAGQSAVDRDGVTYSVATNSNQTYVVAYKGQSQLWSYQAPCPVSTLRVGSDGNVYLIASGAGTVGACPYAHLIGLKATVSAGQTTPDKPMGIDLGNVTVPPGGLAAFNTGLVVETTTGLRFVGYDSSPIRSVGAGLLRDYTGDFAATTTGRAFAIHAADAATRSFCHDNGVASSVDAYGANGSSWAYPLPACSTIYTARPTPSGGVVVHYGQRDPVTSATTYRLLAIDPTGQKAIWSLDLPQTDPTDERLVYNGESYSVDIQGQVLVQRNFMRFSSNYTDRWRGIQLLLISPTGQVSSPYTFAGDPGDGTEAGYGYQGMNSAPATSQDTAFVLAKRCTPWDNCNSTESLHAVTIPGLRIDYPRGELLGAGIPCPGIQFVGVRGSRGSKDDKSDWDNVLTSLRDELTKRYTGFKADSISYPAVPVLDGGLIFYGDLYDGSVKAGKTSLLDYLMQLTARCPSSDLIVAGYSQGAHVAGDVVSEAPLSLRKKLSVVILFGDPRFNPKQTAVDDGAYNKRLSGIYSFFTATKPRVVPSDLSSRAKSYCLQGDLVCNLSPDNYTTCMLHSSTCPHVQYAPTWTRLAAEFAARRLRR
jgi:hypothetical protein